PSIDSTRNAKSTSDYWSHDHVWQFNHRQWRRRTLRSIILAMKINLPGLFHQTGWQSMQPLLGICVLCLLLINLPALAQQRGNAGGFGGAGGGNGGRANAGGTASTSGRTYPNNGTIGDAYFSIDPETRRVVF